MPEVRVNPLYEEQLRRVLDQLEPGASTLLVSRRYVEQRLRGIIRDARRHIDAYAADVAEGEDVRAALDSVGALARDLQAAIDRLPPQPRRSAVLPPPMEDRLRYYLAELQKRAQKVRSTLAKRKRFPESEINFRVAVESLILFAEWCLGPISTTRERIPGKRQRKPALLPEFVAAVLQAVSGTTREESSSRKILSDALSYPLRAYASAATPQRMMIVTLRHELRAAVHRAKRELSETAGSNRTAVRRRWLGVFKELRLVALQPPPDRSQAAARSGRAHD